MTTPSKQPNPSDWPAVKPSRQNRQPKRKWKQRKPGALTKPANKPHNDPTTIINGITAPRKHRGFFVPGFCHQGPLTLLTETGTRQFSQIGARSAPGNKAACRTNNRGRLMTVVEPLRHPSPGCALFDFE
jgi:hypothetical protein